MSELPRKYWFPAKRYGWGWGLPLTWQGWVFLIVWSAALAVGAGLLAPHHRLLYAIFLVAMVAVIFLVCYAKGEPPRWRWGDRDQEPRDGRPGGSL